MNPLQRLADHLLTNWGINVAICVFVQKELKIVDWFEEMTIKVAFLIRLLVFYLLRYGTNYAV